MRTKKQNVRNTKAARRTLLRSRHDKNIARAGVRWDGATKILAFLARGANTFVGAYATERLVASKHL